MTTAVAQPQADRTQPPPFPEKAAKLIMRVATQVEFTDIDKQDLVTYWGGPAADAFGSYTDAVVSNLDENGPAIGDIGTTLGAAVSTVFSTYARAVEIIGAIAAALVKLGANTTLFILTVEVPGLDLLTGAELVQQAIETLGQLIEKYASLIAGALETIGQFKQHGVGFAKAATHFQVPHAPPGAAGQADLWHVNKRT